MGTSSLRTILPGLLLLLSGCCALVYQVARLRELRLVFGASTAANAAVLAIFMGGLGRGGLTLGRRADAHRRPLVLYGRLELGVALSAGGKGYQEAVLTGADKRERGLRIKPLATTMKADRLAEAVGTTRPVLWEHSIGTDGDQLRWQGYTDHCLRWGSASRRPSAWRTPSPTPSSPV